MTKKIWLSFLLLILINNTSFGQQLPQYTQYIFNNYLLNPALSGIENYIDVKAGYRSQWQGLDGAPVTTYLSANMPIGKSFVQGDANAFPGKGTNPMERSFVQEYQAAENHHGIGFHVVFDKAGPLKRTDANLTYAYHLGLTSKMNLAVGVAGGLTNIGLDASKISTDQQNDPAIPNNLTNVLKPDLALGIWLYGPQYFAGFSVDQILGQDIAFTNNDNLNVGKEVPHFFITAGYKFILTDDIGMLPSVMYKHVKPAPDSYDINLKFAFKDRFWLGGSYRNQDSFSAMAGFNISYLFSLSYSYDFTTSELKSVSSGSHEIVLGLLLNNRYKVTCPQRTF
ncbi:type IX secretion system membrane protein PorP/SprF [Pedobacter sp. HMF7647]|uniref:Type IX secretion system membrane protein PorP/SprF n=1 Tax=Hufsiella arboris TaxID=2695275 RepID=A0A7K1YCA9_9SPHI|nr:type IX secretion system membrane protein PorP/SprF [Hufsiella arboris]MXV52223.1 type IX secretion system membrane protein PorP/SprF [Hufsiella arboris]